MDYREQFGPADEGGVAAFEDHVGHPLPTDYRQYLLTVGGGQPEPEQKLGTGDLDADERTHPVVTFFFGIGVDEDALDLDAALDIYRGRMPDELVPIATNDAGDLVCLQVSGESPGAVWSWMHEEEGNEEDQPFWGNLTRVADGFTPFVDALQDLEW